nr:LytR C-terminal domain-containing protein [Modestobacter versicolor]
MPSWASEPGPPTPPPHDVTQRVSSAAPADSPWGQPAAQAAVAAAPARSPQTPARPSRTAPPAPPLASGRPAPRLAPEDPAPEPAAEPERSRRAIDVPVGGRAAARLERQAAEAARKKSGRKVGPPDRPAGPALGGPGRDDERRPDPADGPRRFPRRAVQGLVAFVVVAVGVLGFWSFASPEAEETSAQSPVTSTAPAPSGEALPVQESVAPTAELTPAPVGPVRAPITVLNSTSINGLAGDIGDAFTGGGWEVTRTGESPVQDVATTTVYFTEGDSVQQQAAAQLVEQFPDVSGPVPRYFEVDQDVPGLVVVATGNWRP